MPRMSRSSGGLRQSGMPTFNAGPPPTQVLKERIPDDEAAMQEFTIFLPQARRKQVGHGRRGREVEQDAWGAGSRGGGGHARGRGRVSKEGTTKAISRSFCQVPSPFKNCAHTAHH